MPKPEQKSVKQIVLSVSCIVFIAAFTFFMALWGFHLASRYKATITDLFDSVTEKISGIEDNIKEEAENAINLPKNKNDY